MKSSRRHFLGSALHTMTSTLLATQLPLPAWTAHAITTEVETTQNSSYDLTIGETPIQIAGKASTATGINGTVPGPLLRFREGQRANIRVYNQLTDTSSIHWHGLLLPTNMDGVPGLSFDGIAPGAHYDYEFDLIQNGTYWYHSHSGLQEQTGVYGPLVIYPKDPEPIAYDIEHVLLLSDWTFEDPDRLFANLKMMDDYYNHQQKTAIDYWREAKQRGLRKTLADRLAWGRMRMSQTDIADVTGATYTYLLNGHSPDRNWTGIYQPGQRIRLRIINGSAMSFFNFRIPGLTMTVIAADGQAVQPVDVEEFQIGTAETYDVIVSPGEDQAYTIFAEAMDRSGYALGTLATQKGLSAAIPAPRKPPSNSMKDMGMDHSSMMDHSMPGMDHSNMSMSSGSEQNHKHKSGPGTANMAMMTSSRLGEPGTGLENVGHRVLTYLDLKNTKPTQDTRKPERILELHLTGNMERYMWSFDDIKYTEVNGPIPFNYGERLCLVLVNDTMMSHPIHLHGMFFELDNGNGLFNPRKHTVVVKPAERLMVNITVDAPGLWAFHCHLLYHMKAGMMRAVRVNEPQRSDV